MITDKQLKHFRLGLRVQSTMAAETLYKKSVRGEEIDRQIRAMFHAKFQVIMAYDSQRKVWLAKHVDGDIIKSDTEDGHFIDLTALLEWCIEDMKDN